MAMITNIEEAQTSGFYDSAIIDELEWVQPKMQETFGPVEESFAERPTFVRCMPCGKTHHYRTPGEFQDWAVKHGEMCQVATKGN